VFAAIKKNATTTSLVPAATAWRTSRPPTVPDSENGLEVIWNHITRYRGGMCGVW
jgi:hypothetical protein